MTSTIALRWVPHWVSHMGCNKGCTDYLGMSLRRLAVWRDRSCVCPQRPRRPLPPVDPQHGIRPPCTSWATVWAFTSRE